MAGRAACTGLIRMAGERIDVLGAGIWRPDGHQICDNFLISGGGWEVNASEGDVMLGAMGKARGARGRNLPAGQAVRPLAGLFLACGFTFLAGCSQVPVWLDPTKAESTEPQVLETAAGESEMEFPNLASVPDNPPDVSKPRERQELLEKLQADLATAGDAAVDSSPGQVGRASQSGTTPLAVIYFDRGVTSIGAGNRNILSELVERHWKRGGRLRVVGLASPVVGSGGVASRIANFQIAVARAHNVAATLVNKGVPFVQIDVAARILSADEKEGEVPVSPALQRRAEIFLEF